MPGQVLAQFHRIAREQRRQGQRQHARPDEAAVQQVRPAHRHRVAHEAAQEGIGCAQGGDGHQHGRHGEQGGECAPVESQGH
ncbi:hypothetical protein D3C72_1676140 [compost metagenome]